MNIASIDPSPNALDLLTEQHDKIEQLIAQLSDARISPDTKALVFRTLADLIAAHAAAEEKIFYPAVRAKQTEALVREALQDHGAIKRELADLVLSELDDPRFPARLMILQTQFEHHAREQEEGGLFPLVRALFRQDELAELGGQILAIFEQLLATEPGLDVPRQVHEAAPPP